MNDIKAIQQEISQALNIKQMDTPESIQREINARIDFIKERVKLSGVNALVLGISGGVDSLTTGKLCQLAAEQLREEGLDVKFIAIRLPYNVQADESDAQASLDFIKPDEIQTINIGAGVDGLFGNVEPGSATPSKQDFVKGNVKARARMIAQYAVANYRNGLVVGTDHGAEAVGGFFSKYGDGGVDISPLNGMVKKQVRQVAKALGAPDSLAYKIPTADLEDLEPGKTDESVYGYTYDNIDDFLLGNPVSDEIALRIISRYRNTQHKRDLPYVPA